MSYCPCCNKIIPAQQRVWWEKGKKAIHPECKHVSANEIKADFEKTHKNIMIKFIEEKDGLYHFEAIRAWNGSVYYPKFTKDGERATN